MEKIRVRIAPSPTGFMHVGTARLALFNYAFAKQRQGSLVLRIEDTDTERSKKEYEGAIFAGLKWLSIIPDEGPEKGDVFGPYRQSERADLYKRALETLLQKRAVFYCSHAAASEEEHLIHWCEDYNKNLSSGILRFKTPRDRNIIFQDIIRGEVEFSTETIGDFSVARSIDSPLYHFAVVVDDYLMKISHILRGEDILPSTPKHILMQEALGYQIPLYGHLPLVLGPDRSKLSKRHGPTSLLEFREKGYLPEALLNFLALLGWNPGTDNEIFSVADFIKDFSLEKVQKSGAIFDFAKLDWMNGEYIRQKSVKELAELVKPFLEKSGVFQVLSNQLPVTDDYLEKIIALEQPRLKKLSEIGERTDYFFKDPEYDKELLRWKKMADEELCLSLDKSIQIVSDTNLEFTRLALEKRFLEEIGTGDKGSVLWPLRAALSGKKASPGPFELMDVLGQEETLKRLKRAREIFV